MFKKNNVPWNKGKKHSKETIKKLRISAKKRFESLDVRKQLSEKIKDYYKLHPERKEDIRRAQLGRVSHRKNKTMDEEYGLKKALEVKRKISNTLKKNKKSKGYDEGERLFTNKLKQKVRESTNHNCCLCKRYSPMLQIHHIDYDKSNNVIDNLVPLCPECHGKSNGKMWWKYKIVFETKMYDFKWFVPDKSKLWLNTEYQNHISQINNPFKGDNIDSETITS